MWLHGFSVLINDLRSGIAVMWFSFSVCWVWTSLESDVLPFSAVGAMVETMDLRSYIVSSTTKKAMMRRTPAKAIST
jgi:hypothetical protein